MVVLGAHTTGTAIAIAARRAGYDVIICDAADPPWTRRGCSFTNAWYVGNAEVDGEGAQFCASVKSIPSVLARRDMIAATTWSWQGVAGALLPQVLVDARTDCEPAVLRNTAPEGLLTVGVGRGAAGLQLQVAAEPDERTNLFCTTAAVPGRFATARRIGDRVLAGETVGAIGSTTVTSPCSGVLLGLSARGARLAAGQMVVEVDPAGDPARCFELDQRSRAVAARVIAAVAEVAPAMPRR